MQTILNDRMQISGCLGTGGAGKIKKEHRETLGARYVHYLDCGDVSHIYQNVSNCTF